MREPSILVNRSRLLPSLAAGGLLLAGLSSAPHVARAVDPPGPCAEADRRLAAVTGEAREELAKKYLAAACAPVPSAIVSIWRTGRWPDGAAISSPARTAILAAGLTSPDAPADTIAVELLETGLWPNGAILGIQDGDVLVRALGPALTPYRTRLLLDIYEQCEREDTRLAVLLALNFSKEPWSLLPALDSIIFHPNTPLWNAAVRSIAVFHPTAEAALTDLIRKLPEGPLFEWAARLGQAYVADGHEDPGLVDALYSRGR